MSKLNTNNTIDAFITALATKNYLEGLLCMKLSMDKYNVKHKLYCLVFEDIYDKEIETKCDKLNIILIKVPHINYPKALIDKATKDGFHALPSAIKGYLYSIGPMFNKMIYIDCDMICTQNIDDLFDFPFGSAMAMGEDRYTKAHSGLFIYRPSNNMSKIFQYLVETYGEFDGLYIDAIFDTNMANKNMRIPNPKYGAHVDLKTNVTDTNIKLIHNAVKLKYWFMTNEELSKFVSQNTVAKDIPNYLNIVRKEL